MLRFFAAAPLITLACAGCSEIVDPDTSRLDPPAIDLDSGAPGLDAGAIDPGRTDGGGACAPGAGRCEGDVLVTCEGGAEVRRDCQSERSFCEAATCRAWVCEPGSRACSPDARQVLECDARGASNLAEPCAIACVSGACIVQPGDACEGLPTIAPGRAERFSLCDEQDGDTYRGGSECVSGERAEGGDRTFALTITRAGQYLIDVRDVDPATDIDTVLYVRRACVNQESEIACDDDVPCTQSDIPGGCQDGLQVRQSRVDLRLDVGTYYVVADAILYPGFECGTVELRVSPPR